MGALTDLDVTVDTPAPVLDFACACGAAFQLEDTPRNAGFMRRLVRAHMQECDKVESPPDVPEVESLPLFGEGGA